MYTGSIPVGASHRYGSTRSVLYGGPGVARIHAPYGSGALWFAQISAKIREIQSYDEGAVAYGSCIIFGAAAVLAACAMIVAEITRWN